MSTASTLRAGEAPRGGDRVLAGAAAGDQDSRSWLDVERGNSLSPRRQRRGGNRIACAPSADTGSPRTAPAPSPTPRSARRSATESSRRGAAPLRLVTCRRASDAIGDAPDVCSGRYAAYTAYQCGRACDARSARPCARSSSVSSNTYSVLKHWCAIAVMTGSGSVSSSMRRRVSVIRRSSDGVADHHVFQQAQQQRLIEWIAVVKGRACVIGRTRLPGSTAGCSSAFASSSRTGGGTGWRRLK